MRGHRAGLDDGMMAADTLCLCITRRPRLQFLIVTQVGLLRVLSSRVTLSMTVASVEATEPSSQFMQRRSQAFSTHRCCDYSRTKLLVGVSSVELLIGRR